MRLWIVLFPLFLVSCSFQATLTLSPGGGAEAMADIRVSAAAQAAWDSLRDLDGSLPADPLDPRELQSQLGARGKVSASAGTTRISFPVADVTKFVPTWKTSGSVWEGSIDRTALERWIGLTDWAGSAAIESLLPAPGTKVTEAEYRDLLVYLLGPGTQENAAKALIDGSSVQLTVVAPQTLKAAPGAVAVSGRTAVYRWPLVRVLALEKPLLIRLLF